MNTLIDFSPKTKLGKFTLVIIIVVLGLLMFQIGFLLAFGFIAKPYYENCNALDLPTSSNVLTQKFGPPISKSMRANGDLLLEYEPSFGYIYIYSTRIHATKRGGTDQISDVTCAELD